MSLTRIKMMASIAGLDFGKLEEQFVAALLHSDAVGITHVDGKPEIHAIDYKTMHQGPHLVIFDDFSKHDHLRDLYNAIPVQEEPAKVIFDRKRANRRTKDAKKPLPYYHGQKRRF